MPVRASPRTGRLKPMLRVPPPARGLHANGNEGSPTPGPDKVKAKAKGPERTERRVLPARMRRAAGSGAEGVRDIEEMVVDWLERWGDVDPAPPESVVVRISTAPLKGTYAVEDANVEAGPSTPVHVAPQPTSASPAPTAAGPAASPYAPTPSPALPPLSLAPGLTVQPSQVSSACNTPVPGVQRIETPAWIMVKAGEDDAEEARQELVTGANRSPSKRLRHGVVGQEVEDTSDAYYEAAHRRFEAFEKRQRIREKEQLQFNRYKMRARVDLLRNMPGTQWGAMVAAILARDGDETWARGRRKLESVGNDWLRRHLIREGLEVLRRYDELLPKLGEKPKPASPASSSPPPPAKPVIKLRLFSSAQREAEAREAAASASASQRSRSRSSSVSSLSDCEPSSPASVQVMSSPSVQAISPLPSVGVSATPSPVPLRLKLARPKGDSLQTTLTFGRPSPSPTKLAKARGPPEAAASQKVIKPNPRVLSGSASTEGDGQEDAPRKLRRANGDADTNRRRSLRTQPKNALRLVEDDEADMAGVEAEVLKL